MRSKKFLLLVLLVTVSFIMCGCDNKSKKETDNKNVTSESNATITSSKYTVKINGAVIKVGDKLDDVKDKIGDEIQPAEVSNPCGVETKGDSKIHFFKDVTIMENYQGIIYQISMSKFDTPDTIAELSSGIKLTDSSASVKSALEGESIVSESDYMVIYGNSSFNVSLIFDEDKLEFITVTDNSIEL